MTSNKIHDAAFDRNDRNKRKELRVKNKTTEKNIIRYGVNNVYVFYFNIEHSLMCIQYNIFVCIIYIYNNNCNNNIVLVFYVYKYIIFTAAVKCIHVYAFN